MTKTDTLRGRFSTTAARKWIAQNAFIPNQSDCWPTREVVRAMTEFAESCQPTEAEIEEVARALEAEQYRRACNEDDEMRAPEFAELLRGKLGGTNG